MSRYTPRHAPRHAAAKRSTTARAATALRRPAVSGSLVLAVVGTGAAGVQSGAAAGHAHGAATFTVSAEAVAQSNELSNTTLEDTARLTAARNGAVALAAANDGKAKAMAAANDAKAKALALARAAKIAADRKAAAERAARAAERKAIVANAQSNPKGAAQMLMGDYGFGAGQWGCLEQLWNGESGWNYRAYNAGSGATGIPQSLPGSKMGTVAPDWRTNPVTQIRWGLGYIKSSYGSPCNAWSIWQSRYPHWY